MQVHAALSLVSSSVRDLLVRYPIFKTSQVLIPASHLVHSVKGLFNLFRVNEGKIHKLFNALINRFNENKEKFCILMHI